MSYVCLSPSVSSSLHLGIVCCFPLSDIRVSLQDIHFIETQQHFIKPRAVGYAIGSSSHNHTHYLCRFFMI